MRSENTSDTLGRIVVNYLKKIDREINTPDLRYAIKKRTDYRNKNGRFMRVKSFRKFVLRPLEQQGFIKHRRGGTSGYTLFWSLVEDGSADGEDTD